MHVDNHRHKGPHGGMLERIYNVTYELAEKADILVRERGFSRFRNETQALFKVVGVCDLAAWKAKGMVFEEIAPAMVKKLVAGKGNATKEEVATALERHIGQQTYTCDDQSDAAALGVAWAIKNEVIGGSSRVKATTVGL